MPLFGSLFLLAILLPQGHAAKQHNYCQDDDHGTATPNCEITNKTFGCPDETQFLQRRFLGLCCCDCPRNLCTYKGHSFATNCHSCPSKSTTATPTHVYSSTTVKTTPANTGTSTKGGEVNHTSTTRQVTNSTTLQSTSTAITSTRDSPSALPSVKPTTNSTTTAKPVKGDEDWKVLFFVCCGLVIVLLIAIACLIYHCRKRGNEGREARDRDVPTGQGIQPNGHSEERHRNGAVTTESERNPLMPLNIPGPDQNGANSHLLPNRNAASESASEVSKEMETSV